MLPPKSISFQDFFNKYCNVFAIQGALPKFLNYNPTSANLLLNNFKPAQGSSGALDLATLNELVNYQNSLYQFQNDLELERSIAKKFTTSVVAPVDLVIYNQYKNQVKLEKFKQQNKDLISFDPEVLINYIGLYYSAKANPFFDNQASFFGLDYKERLGHTLISGNCDSGKNRVIMNMYQQDMLFGLGGVLITSNHDLCKNILATVPDIRVEDMIYFKPGDPENGFGIDLFDGKDIDSTMETVLDIFKNVWQGEISDKITYYLEPVLHLLLKNKDKSSFSDYINVIYDKAFRTQLMKEVTDFKIIHFWKNLTNTQLIEMQSTLIKLETINRNKVIRETIENAIKQVKISDIITKNKFLIVDLSNLAEDNVSSRFIGNLILKKVAQISGEVRIKGIFPMYVDEFWNYTGQDLFAKNAFLRKNKVALTYTQQGTFNKNDDPKLGIVSFGSFTNKLTFNTSDPYSSYNNHSQEMEIDAILKKLPNDACMFEGNLQNQPTNPFLIEVIQKSFLPVRSDLDSFNKSINFDFVKPKLKVEISKKPESSASKPASKPPVSAPNPVQKPTSKPVASVQTKGSTQSSDAKSALLQEKLELENKLRYDAEGNLRKTALNSSRRKKIFDKIRIIDAELALL